MATWRIDVVTLNNLWSHVYPRIIGHAWVDAWDPKTKTYDQKNPYISSFYGDEDDVEKFLRREFLLRGIVLDPNLSLRIYDSNDTNFILSIGGDLTLPSPWHLKPSDANGLYEAYKTQENVRRSGQIAFPGTPKGLSLFSAINIMAAVPSGYFRGDDYRKVLDEAPKKMADVWSENHANASKREQAFIKKMLISDIRLPKSPQIMPKVTETELNYFMTGDETSWSFYFPMPAPPTLSEMFRKFASGEASNPMYTGTT